MPTLTTTYRADQTTSATIAPWLKLDQPDYNQTDTFANISTILTMVNLARAGQNAQQALELCDGLVTLEDGAFEWTAKVYVYVSDENLEYSLKATRGNYGEMTLEPVHHEQSFTFGSADSINVGLLIHDGWQAVWETPAYNSRGEIISPPNLTAKGQYLIAAQPCFGVVRLSYDSLRHVWPLTIPDDGTEDAFKSTVSCFWEGEVQQIDIETAPCVADRLAKCGEGGGFTLKQTGDQLYVKYDACRGNVVEEYYDD